MPNREWPGAGPFWRPVGPYLQQGSSPSGPVPPALYGTQENVDLSISSWSRGTGLLAQGLVPLMLIAGPQFNPQQVQAQIFPTVRTPPATATAVETFVQVGPQQYVDSPSRVFPPQIVGATPRVSPLLQGGPQPDLTQVSSFFPAVRTPPAATSGNLGAQVRGAPELADLSIASWSRGTGLLAQGAVPPFISAAPQVDQTPLGAFWESAASAPAATFGPVPPFVKAPPQADPSQIAARVFPSVRTPPAAGTLILRFIATLPQSDQTPTTALVWSPAYDAQGSGLSVEYRFGAHAVAIHNAETLKSRFWSSLATPPSVTGILGQFVATVPQLENRQFSSVWASQKAGQPTPILQQLRGAPQVVDLTQQGSIFPAAKTQPVQGAVPPFTFGQPQADPSGNQTQVWTPSTFSPSAPTPPVVDGVPAPVGHPVYVKGNRKKPRYYETANEQLKKILDSIKIEVVTPESKTTDAPVLVKAISGERVKAAVETVKKAVAKNSPTPSVLPPEEDDDEEIIALYIKGGFL